MLNHQKKNKAGFVDLKDETVKFKYKDALRKSKYFNNRLVEFKRYLNKFIQKPKIWLNKLNLKSIREDSITWFVEALIEGFLINYVVWALLGLKFNLITIVAWGILLKQLLSIYWRLRKNGSITKVHV